MGKKGSGSNSADPKTTALTHLGICIGSKNLKTLRREEVDNAFCNQFLASIYMSDGGKLGSRKQYQRILHESYQFLVKFILEQQAAELAKSNKGNSNNNNNAINTAGSKSPSRKH